MIKLRFALYGLIYSGLIQMFYNYFNLEFNILTKIIILLIVAVIIVKPLIYLDSKLFIEEEN